LIKRGFLKNDSFLGGTCAAYRQAGRNGQRTIPSGQDATCAVSKFLWRVVIIDEYSCALTLSNVDGLGWEGEYPRDGGRRLARLAWARWRCCAG